MFPPSPPTRWISIRGGGGTAHYQPRTALPLPPGTEFYTPPPDAPLRQGIAHLAGRLLPLPAGVWHELLVLKGGGSGAPQTDILYRVSGASGGDLTGLIFASGPGPATGAVGSAELPLPCQDVGLRPGEIVPTLQTQSPLAHECWVLNDVDTAHTDKQALLHLALSRLASRHVVVPPQMVGIDYVRTDETGWMNVVVLLPGGRGRLKPIQAWMARFARPLHRGYDRNLVVADLTPAAVDDPR